MLTLAIIMGLAENAEDPSDPCLGMRPFCASLRRRHDLNLIFASHHREDVADRIVEAPRENPIMIVGFSLGGDNAVRTCARLMALDRRVGALCLLEPVPKQHWLNPLFRFDTVANADLQICFHSSMPWPIGWGRRYRDESLNVGVWAKHDKVPSRPKVLEWIRTTVAALARPTPPSRGLAKSIRRPRKKRKRKAAHSY